MQQLVEIDESDLHATLQNADHLVKATMGALRKAQMARCRAMTAVEHMVDMIIDTAWHDIRCRHEWRQINARVEKWARESGAKAKHRRKKQPSVAREHGCKIGSFPEAIDEIQIRTLSYRHNAAGVAGALRLGVASVACSDDCLFDSNIFDEVNHQPVRGLPKIPATKKRAPITGHPQSWAQTLIEKLDAASERDRGLALARRDEISLKLAVEISLAEQGNSVRK